MNYRGRAQQILHRLGYEIYQTGKGKQYNLCPPYDYATYSPWFEDWFQESYNRIRAHTKVTEDRCYMIHRLCSHCLHVDGDFAECGVYKGGTSYFIADLLLNNSSRERELHLFDTFSGMPAIANEDPSAIREGWFGDTSLRAVHELLKDFNNVVFHPGIIPETFGAVQDKKFAFVHIDVDLYQTTLDCCNFFYERMPSGGIIVFDDYGFRPFLLAEKQAVDEFFADKRETTIALRTGQCIVIKL